MHHNSRFGAFCRLRSTFRKTLPSSCEVSLSPQPLGSQFHLRLALIQSQRATGDGSYLWCLQGHRLRVAGGVAAVVNII